MPDWCDPIRAALDGRHAPCTVFFRDDDAGWDDARLFALLDVFARHDLPVDLAVIPAALTPRLARRLLARMRAGERVRVHQHGYAHLDHESQGKKCEFGPARDAVAQHVDLVTGRTIMQVAFGPFADPIFTPPWNRCTADTAAGLEAIGFRALSRDVGAKPAFDGRGFDELPVAVDWCRLRAAGAPPDALGERIAAQLAATDRAGIMLHHVVMDDADLALLDTLLALLQGHAAARCVAMRALLQGRHRLAAITSRRRRPALAASR